VNAEPRCAAGGAELPAKVAAYSLMCVTCLDTARAASGYTEPWRPPPGPIPQPHTPSTMGFYEEWDAKKRSDNVVPIRPTSSQGEPSRRLLGLLRTVNTAPGGQRNATLFWAASRAGEMVAAGELDAAHATATLRKVGLAVGLTPAEIDGTVRSGLNQSGVAS
jgi:hypothetical protein